MTKRLLGGIAFSRAHWRSRAALVLGGLGLLLVAVAGCGEDAAARADGGVDGGVAEPDAGLDGGVPQRDGSAPDASRFDGGPDGGPGPAATAFGDASRTLGEIACRCSECDPDVIERQVQLALCMGRILEPSGDEEALEYLACFVTLVEDTESCLEGVECGSDEFAVCNDAFADGVRACAQPESARDAQRECTRRLSS